MKGQKDIQKNKDQKEVWNKIAKKWGEYRNTQTKNAKDFLIGKKGNVLDLGCGAGREFCKIDGTIYGVDFSEMMIKLAESRAKELGVRAKLFVTESDKLPFEDNFFDVAIYSAALHCLESAEKRKNSLKELYRVLKPKARVIISVWSKNHDRIKKGEKEQHIPWTVEDEKLYRYYYIYDKEELEDLIKKTGFRIITSEEGENIVIEAEK